MFAFSSCSDYLDKTPDENMSLEDVFANRNYAEGWLAGAYGLLPFEGYDNTFDFFGGFYSASPYSSASDEIEMCLVTSFGNYINRGDWNPLNITTLTMWNNSYLAIRKLNIFLEYANGIPTTNEEKGQWIGEAYFLRAFFYFNLVRNWGAVPIVNTILGTSDDISIYERRPVNECIQQIVNDCNLAYDHLDLTIEEAQYGRATSAAALALKSKALLYMASPLFNGGTVGRTDTPDLTKLVNNDGTRLFPDRDDNRWKAAVDAAKQCIEELEAAGYGLYYAAGNDPVDSYRQLFVKTYNKEVLFARNNGANQMITFSGYPRSQSGWGSLAPIQALVDAYEMADGSTPILGYKDDGTPIVNEESGYVEGPILTKLKGKYYPSKVDTTYTNREPRFYASINFTGQLGYDNKPFDFQAGKKDGYVSTSGENFCKTGYLQKKYVLDGANPQTGRVENSTWIFFRLGEIYLNYAEALNESKAAPSDGDDIYKYVNLIRERAGLPELPSGLTKEEMRKKIQHERRIELAFENHRFFDVRRWLIAGTTQAGKIYGMDIKSIPTASNPLVFYTRTEIEERIFDPRHYLFPIPQGDIDKNRKIIQNPGWN